MGKFSKLTIFTLAAALSLATPIPARADSAAPQVAVTQPGEIPISEFHEVSPGIFRGARPGAAGIKALSELGIKTILNLDNSVSAGRAEQELTARFGIRYLPLPMSAFSTPADSLVDEALAALADPAKRPIFVHCKHGQDRTGLIVGLYRVFHEGWDAEAAYDEMLKYNFHPILLGLDNYYRKKTRLGSHIQRGNSWGWEGGFQEQ